MPLDLNLMRLLVAIVEAGTLSGAAQRIGVTRSQASRGLKALERDMGTLLVRRTTRKLELTQHGELVHEHAVRQLKEMETARYLVQQSGSEPSGHVRVSVPTALGELLLCRLLIDFALRYEGISVQVRLSNRVSDLISSEIDVAVRVVDQPPEDYVARSVGTVEWCLCAGPGYLARVGRIRVPADISGLALLMPPTGKRSNMLMLERVTERHPVKVNTKLESESFPFWRKQQVWMLASCCCPGIMLQGLSTARNWFMFCQTIPFFNPPVVCLS